MKRHGNDTDTARNQPVTGTETETGAKGEGATLAAATAAAARCIRYIQNNKGSTIVGVIAALVFITVVAAFMVKNTGAQAAASVGYTSDQVMVSTVNSGVVATESFFYNNRADTGLKAIGHWARNEHKTGTDKERTFLLGSADKSKQIGAGTSKQFFSSEMLSYSDLTKNAEFKVRAAKSEKGKGMKEARAFYKLMNTTLDVPRTTPTVRPGQASNAMYSNSGFTGSHGGTIIGNATFEDTITFQQLNLAVKRTPIDTAADGTVRYADDGKAYFAKTLNVPGGSNARFENDVYVRGNSDLQGESFFGGQAHFKNNVSFTSEKNITFIEDVYIGGHALFQSNNANARTVFNGHVYFDSTVLIGTNSNVKFNGNVYFRLGVKSETDSVTFGVGSQALFNSNAEFNGAIFKENVHIRRNATFNRRVIFEKQVRIDSNATFNYNANSEFVGAVYIGGNANLMNFNSTTPFTSGIGVKGIFEGKIRLSGTNNCIRDVKSGSEVIGNSSSGCPASCSCPDVCPPSSSCAASCPAVGCPASPGNTLTAFPERNCANTKEVFYKDKKITQVDSVWKLGVNANGQNASDWRHHKDKDTLPVITGSGCHVVIADWVTKKVDPQLDVTKIYDYENQKYPNNPGAIVKKETTTIRTVRDGLDELDINLINAKFDAAANAGELYEGHLVIEVTGVHLLTNKVDGKPFTRKIIFILKGTSSIGASSGNISFYDCKTGSSTLIYISGNSYLNNFGSGYPFIGLIYIHKDNTAKNNTMKWKEGGSITGAFHNFSNEKVFWNFSETSNTPTPVTFSAAALDEFKTLITSDGNDDIDDDDDDNNNNDDEITGALETAGKPITPVMGGFYFY